MLAFWSKVNLVMVHYYYVLLDLNCLYFIYEFKSIFISEISLCFFPSLIRFWIIN